MRARRMLFGRWIALVSAAPAFLAADAALANNMSLTNVAIKPRDDSTVFVQFEIRWENSWRHTNINHDAAWVFFKVKPEGRVAWEHAILETNGQVAGTGTAVEIVVPSDRVGCFIRRSGEGSGTVSVTNVKVAWNFASNSLAKTDRVRVAACAVEMVYVAEGGFWAGNTNVVINNSFRALANSNAPIAIASTNAFDIYWGAGPSTATVANAFPNGYAAFYCMKYEATQGQYRDFLNSLTRAQQRTHTAGQEPCMFAMSANNWANSYGNAIRCPFVIPPSPPPIVFGCDGNTNLVMNETNDAMDRACNFLSWADATAFADWSGLRPMTELEFEKACRGPLPPVSNEYAWGDAVLVVQTNHAGVVGTGRETAMPANACCNASNKMTFPSRVGIFATGSSSRQAAGASYWGIMELSGNVCERIVTVGNATGRLFTGLHGDGQLTSRGDANVAAWPGKDSTGSGIRGGNFSETTDYARTADRYEAATAGSTRSSRIGWRGVRTAPDGTVP